MARARFVLRPTPVVTGTPFCTAEDAWLWAAHSARHAEAGAHLTANQSMLPRPCEPRDVIALICRLRRNGSLSGPQLAVLCEFGVLDRPPDTRNPNELHAFRQWETALDRLQGPLVDKGIVASVN